MHPSNKNCKKCGFTRPHSDFAKDASRKDGLNLYCRACNRQVRLLCREARSRYNRKFYLANKDSVLTRVKLWASNNKDKRKNASLKRRYGITLEQYNEILKAQDFKCALCGSKADLHLDHCHNTGKVRGILCGNCNRALGLFSDNPATLNKAADYVRR